MKILIPCVLSNPIATSWVCGLQQLGHRVVIVEDRFPPADPAQLATWGIPPETPLIAAAGPLQPDQQRRARDLLDGEPDVVFSWWGGGMLAQGAAIKAGFPDARWVHCIDTFPNASNQLTEFREIWWYRRADPLVDAYVYYSRRMRELFARSVRPAAAKPYLELVEPMPLRSYTRAGAAHHGRTATGDRPRVVFTGRSDLLWSRDMTMRKDAVGPALQALAERGVDVYVSAMDGVDISGIQGMHTYPRFTHEEVLAGRFATYVNQFDANLVFYNAWNGTIRRRVRTSLSTRLSSALTCTTPIVVNSASTFVHDLWGAKPFGFAFDTPDDTSERLRDREYLNGLRANLEASHRDYAFEAQAQRIQELLDAVTA